MSAAKHTPGPWTVGEFGTRVDAPGNPQLAITTGRIVNERHDWSEAKANAQLIAAAPDLLDAAAKAETMLGALLSFYGQGLSVHGWHQNGQAEPLDSLFDENMTGGELEGLRAALKKARGE